MKYIGQTVLAILTLVLGLGAGSGGVVFGQSPVEEAQARLLELGYEGVPQEMLVVIASEQRLYHIADGSVAAEYVISTGEKGLGSERGSFRTPLGLHRVAEKHGEGVPLLGRMIGRVFYGQIASLYEDTTRSDTDDITTRLLWLAGMEPGVNQGGDVDTYSRYIYIHGTSEEGRLGTPASHGCIRMRNRDVLELYGTIEVGTWVLILAQ
jgi:hypothetical protein